jgi:hypothetical protein
MANARACSGYPCGIPLLKRLVGQPGPTVRWSVCREAPFFGFSLIPTDYVIFQSTFFQRVICVFLVLDG